MAYSFFPIAAEGKKVHIKPDDFESNHKIIWRKNVRYIGAAMRIAVLSLMHPQQCD